MRNPACKALAIGCWLLASLQANAEAWSYSAARSDTPSRLRILLLYDMEGLSGLDDMLALLQSHPKYANAQKSLANDVNAVVDGLFSGGAEEVWVVDGHGSGNTGPDLPTEMLDPRAAVVRRDQRFDPYVDVVAEGEFAGLALVGMHGKSGSGGFAAHTKTIGVQIFVNGYPVSETEIIALSYGEQNIPVIFVSGDDVLRKGLKEMPWIEYVEVKHALTASDVTLYPAEQVTSSLRNGAQRAMAHVDQARLMRLSTPISMAVVATAPADLSWIAGMPGVNYRNQRISYEAESFHAAYAGLIPILKALSFAYNRYLYAPIPQHGDRQSLELAGEEELFRQWALSENGQLQEPAEVKGTVEYGSH